VTDRTTRELIALVLVATLAVVLVLVVGGVVTVEVVNPDVDTSRAVGAVGSALSALTGVVVGYLIRGERGPRAGGDGPE
jgi:hypothetical protein